MTNKEYKIAREQAEDAAALYTFMHWNGYSVRPSRYMDDNDKRVLKAVYKEDKKENGAFALDGFNNRAVIIPVDGGYLLKSYHTTVAAFVNGAFYRLWNGYSVTTAKHVDIFREWLNMPKMSKREWIETPVHDGDIIDNETGVVVYGFVA